MNSIIYFAAAGICAVLGFGEMKKEKGKNIGTNIDNTNSVPDTTPVIEEKAATDEPADNDSSNS